MAVWPEAIVVAQIWAERIRERRIARGWSQRDLGAAIGVTGAAIRMYELGKRRPDPETLVRLATVLQTSAAYLLGETDDPRPPQEGDGTSGQPHRRRPSPMQQLRELGAMLRGAGATEEDVRIIMELLERRRRLREQAEGSDKPQQ